MKAVRLFVIALALMASVVMLAGCSGGAKACASNRQALTGGIAVYSADNETPKTIDQSVAQKLLDAGYIRADSASDLLCPSGGTYTMGGDFNGQVVCSKHKD